MVDVLARASTALLGIQDVGAVLLAIVEAAGHAVPGAHHVGISLQSHGRLTGEAPTDPLVERVDALQAELGEGPCIEVIHTREAVVALDLATEHRWPAFTPRARELGLSGLASFPLLTGPGRARGALNLHLTPGDVLTPSDLTVAQLFAAQASVALDGAGTAEGLRRALDSRDLIGQAKGVLMSRHGIDADAAYAMLVEASQDTNIKLVEVARWTVGNLAVDPAGPPPG